MLEKILTHVDENLDASLVRLFNLLKIPSISTDPAYAEQCRMAANWCVNEFSSLGFMAETRETGGHPVVIAKNHTNAKDFTLFYGHYDVQPVDPLELWETSPFEPRLVTRDDGSKAIVARGACDDKGQMLTFIEALRAYKAVTGKLPLPLTLMIEGEEENGSKNLFAFVKNNAQEFSGKLGLVCDTGMWDSETPQISTSLRGMVYEEVKIIAADRDLHSGHFGGTAANPINILSRILADLHDEDGRIMVKDFYEGVEELPNSIKAEWADLDVQPKDFLGPIGLSEPVGEKGRMMVEMMVSRPTCDVNGIWGGYTGVGSKTVIASEANAKVSFRLVSKQDPHKIKANFHAFVRARLPKDCKVEFISMKATPALQVPYDMPELIAARAALHEEWAAQPVLIGSGGSIPIVGDFKRVLGMNSLLIGFGLDDDRIHSPNEKYDLKSFHKGIRSWVRVLDKLTRS